MGKFPIYNFDMTSLHLPRQTVLPLALAIMRPLVTWLLRSGIGYGEFCSALKALFLECAQQEQTRRQGKLTDSALSLLSGLHRKDVRGMQSTAANKAEKAAQLTPLNTKATPANQVLTRWLADGLPPTLPTQGPAPSFEALARSVSKDIHPHTVLKELQRLGLVDEHNSHATLKAEAFMPDTQHQEAQQLFVSSVADHLCAGVHNLTGSDGKKFMEQSVFADGLSESSVQALAQLANDLWRQVLTAMVKAAVPLCERDEPLGGSYRLRLGMFCWSADTDTHLTEEPLA